jgi:hypothetical protein
MYCLLVISLWFVTTVLYFHKELSLFFTRKKGKRGAVALSSAEVFIGISKDVFPQDAKNIRDDDSGESIALNVSDFDIEYGGMEDEEDEENRDFSLDGEKNQAPTIISFDEMRHAVSVVEDKNIDVLDTSNGAVSAARKTFKLLEETALLAEMLKGKREISERIEQLMDKDK